MIFGRSPFARLPFALNRVPENFAASAQFSSVETLQAAGRLDATSAADFAQVETLQAAGRLDAASAADFSEVETLRAETEVETSKFLRLINAPTARRVYVVEMTIQRFR